MADQADELRRLQRRVARLEAFASRLVGLLAAAGGVLNAGRDLQDVVDEMFAEEVTDRG